MWHRLRAERKEKRGKEREREREREYNRETEMYRNRDGNQNCKHRSHYACFAVYQTHKPLWVRGQQVSTTTGEGLIYSPSACWGGMCTNFNCRQPDCFGLLVLISTVMVAPSNTPRSPCEEHAHPLNLDLYVHASLSLALCSLSKWRLVLYTPCLTRVCLGLGRLVEVRPHNITCTM